MEYENCSEKRTESDSESEEGEIDDAESDFENHDTSQRDGCYPPITALSKMKYIYTRMAKNTGLRGK